MKYDDLLSYVQGEFQGVTWERLQRYAKWGNTSRLFKGWMYRHIKDEPEKGSDFEFYLRDAMEDIGLDFYDRRDYGKAQRYYKKQRDSLCLVFLLNMDSKPYIRARENKLSRDDIFDLTVNAGISREVYPWGGIREANWKFKRMNYDRFMSWTYGINQRALKSIRNNIKKHLLPAMSAIPEIKDDIIRLPMDDYEHIAYKLPPRVICPFCGEEYLATELEEHKKRHHMLEA